MVLLLLVALAADFCLLLRRPGQRVLVKVAVAVLDVQAVVLTCPQEDHLLEEAPPQLEVPLCLEEDCLQSSSWCRSCPPPWPQPLCWRRRL